MMTTSIHRKTSARRALRHVLATLMAVVAICAGTACGDDLLERDDTDLADGEQKATLEIALSPVTSAQRTRAGEDGDLQIKEVWIGVFDHQSNKLISSWPREKVGQDKIEQLAGDGKTINAKISFLYNDKTTKQVKIAAVANYSGINGYMTKKQEAGWADQEGTIENLLKEVETWEDYLSISVDTKSATDVARGTGYCIMSSIATKENKTAALPTADLKANSISTNDATYLFETNGYSGPNIGTAYLYLRRLIVDNTVVISAGKNIKLDNVKYRVFNIPKRSYVQERTMTVLENSDWNSLNSWTNYFDRSPNASDFHVEGKPLYMDDEEESKAETDGETTAETEEKKYTFSFSHYDNKHWGLKDGVCTGYYDREKIWTGKTDALEHEVYSSLCITAEKPYNNYATYFQIMAYVEETDREGNTIRKAQAVYTIHEGYCNAANLTAETDSEKKSRDFMAVRNTKYTYKVTINGLKGMEVQVVADDKTTATPGVTGTIWGNQLTEQGIIYGNPPTASVTIPSGGLQWLIKGEDGKYHGTFSEESVKLFSSKLEGLSGFYSCDDDNEAESLAEDISFTPILGGDPIGYPFENMEAGEYTLTFHDQNQAKQFYLLSTLSSEDGRTHYVTLVNFPQTQLATPQATFEDTDADTPKTEKEIYSQESIKISWPAVYGAEYYEVTYDGKTTIIEAEVEAQAEAGQKIITCTIPAASNVQVTKQITIKACISSNDQNGVLSSAEYRMSLTILPKNRRWDFTNWSEETKANVIAGSEWTDKESDTKDSQPNKCYWQMTSSATLQANGTVIAEAEGLVFTNSIQRNLAIAIDYDFALNQYYGNQYLWLYSNVEDFFYIPNVLSGSIITMGIESHKESDARGVDLYLGDTTTTLDRADGKSNYPKTYEEQKWVVDGTPGEKYNIRVRNSAGCHIYFIEETEPKPNQ